MRIEILSLFPGYFRGPFEESILKRAQELGAVEIDLVNLRDYAEGRHRVVDDRPYGGGPGMVLKVDPVVKAIRDHRGPKSRVIYLSPQGERLTAQKCHELAAEKHLILLCGHYEGIDQRAIDLEVDEELSIGDYVLTNGCLPAIVLVDAVVRLLPGVLGDPASAVEESFEGGLLDSPHYTRPEVCEGLGVPEELLSGSHERIARWRRRESVEKTARVRPDLYWDYLRGLCGELGPGPLMVVADVERSRRFYREELGARVKRVSERLIAVEFAGERIFLVEGQPDGGSSIVRVSEEKETLQLIDPDGIVWWIGVKKEKGVIRDEQASTDRRAGE